MSQSTNIASLNKTNSNTKDFLYKTIAELIDGDVILPALECKCLTVNPEFWEKECISCHSSLSDANVIYNPEDPDIKYLVLQNQALITKFQNASTWICTGPIGHNSKCLTLNDEASSICSSLICGASRDSNGVNIPKRVFTSGKIDSPVDHLGLRKVIDASGNLNITLNRKTINLSSNQIVKGLITAGAVSIIAVTGNYWLMPTTQTSVVISSNWQTVVHVQTLTPENSSGWSTPIGAYNITSTTQVKGQEQYITGSHVESISHHSDASSSDCSYTSGATIVRKTCSTPSKDWTEQRTVNEYGSRDVYAQYYTYTEDNWVETSQVPNSGTNFNPLFSNVSLFSNQKSYNTCNSNLFINDKDGNKQAVSVTCDAMPSFAVGDSFHYKHNRAGASWGAEH